MIWESFATRIIKHRAQQKGYGLSDYSKAYAGVRIRQTICVAIAPNSLFVFGRTRSIVPGARTNGLMRALNTHVPRAHIAKVDGGHFKTLVESGRHQRALAGACQPHDRGGYANCLNQSCGLSKSD